MISHEHKFIHLHNPKCGGTSIEKALGRQSDITAGHFPASYYDKELWERYFTFCFVRNPWDRVVSSYAYHVLSDYEGSVLRQYPNLKSFSFEEYVKLFAGTGYIRPQIESIRHDKSNKPIDFIGRFENIESDFRKVCDILKIEANRIE